MPVYDVVFETGTSTGSVTGGVQTPGGSTGSATRLRQAQPKGASTGSAAGGLGHRVWVK